jgi:DNA (cytosine-5)-methyltransferase 1
MEAGFDVVFAFDNDPVSVKTYNLNLPPHAHCLDATALSAEELLERAGLAPGECDLLVGGPPCQGFSIQRHDGADDPRNQLVLTFLSYILGLRPKAFLMENVPALMSRRGKHLVDELTGSTEAAGYVCSSMTLDAADFGVPQHRKRTFVVGAMGGVGPFQWPRPRDGSPLTVRDAIADLPSPPLDGSPHGDIPNHYRESRLSALNIERIRYVPPGGGREHLPKHLQLQCHSGGHRHLDTYGRLAWDAPSVTLTARFDSFTRGRFGHPVEDRSITLREGARLQGFPDSHIFLGSREDGARMIGNAVPPPLASVLAGAINRSPQEPRPALIG